MIRTGDPHGLPKSAAVDHLVYAAPDLRMGVERIRELLGVEPVAGGRHPRWGTRNALVGLGPDTYLEVIGPDPDETAPPSPRPFDLDRRPEPGLGGWAVRTSGVEDGARAARRLGFDLGEVLEGERMTPDGDVLRWRLTDPCAPRDGGTVPFLIDWGQSTHPSESLDHAVGLRRLHLRHPEPDRLRALLSPLAPRVVVEAGDPPRISATLETSDGPVALT